jgi:cephalosporin hydroxylase
LVGNFLVYFQFTSIAATGFTIAIVQTKPDFVIETGTARGGSALFLAHICDVLGKGRVITIDIKENPNRPRHERITYLHGSSTSKEVLSEVKGLVGDGSALVILDSDHSKDHVIAELRAYSRFVNDGGYLIVEDTNVNGHPVLPEYGPGPMEAVEAFLEANKTSPRTKAKRNSI